MNRIASMTSSSSMFAQTCPVYRITTIKLTMTINANGTPLTLRVLCLHDNNSNAFELKNEFRSLGKKLYENHSVDLVYVNGPLVVTSTDTSTDTNQNYLWWEEHNDSTDESSKSIDDKFSRLDIQNSCSIIGEKVCNENSESSSNALLHTTKLERCDPVIPIDQTMRYHGLDASLMLLRQIWTSCPFWGILGVGKGAAVASLFTTILESEMLTYHAATNNAHTSDSLPHVHIPPNVPELIILVSGESLLSVDEALLVCPHYNTAQPTSSPFILHLVDHDIPPAQELLIRQFCQGSQIERRENSLEPSCVSFSQSDLNVIGRFICRRKKELYNSSMDDTEPLLDHKHHPCKILALQNALYNAEQDAANCIAETIALNPPAALMAVIRPQMVAGWEGNRRPQPEGGGAPCPEEFLHRKTKKDATDP